MRKLWLILALLVLSVPAFATHTCTTCYISNAGSDSNDGTTKIAGGGHGPWAHAPGMSTATGNAASQVPVAGDSYIFRGGDTWHTSTGTPIGMPWTFSASGSSGSPIYIGVDVTYFSGSSFARPIFTMDNALTTASPPACSHDDTTTNGIDITGAWVTVDNFEFTGKCWAGANPTGHYTLQLAGANDKATNNYIHGWSVATSAGDDSHVMISPTGATTEISYNVIDGFDSTFGATCTTPGSVNSSSCKATGFAIGYTGAACYNIHHNVIRHVSNGIQCPNINIVHDNLFEYSFSPQFGGRHGNTLETIGGTLGATFYFYNNVMHNDSNAVQLWPQASTMYIFNNVMGDTYNGGNSPPDPNCLLMSPPGLGAGGPVIHVSFYNNTVPSTCHMQAFGGNPTTPHWGAGSSITFENNHIIGKTSIAQLFSCDSGSTCSVVDSGGEVFQTSANATAQGYTNANDYAPTASSNATVGTGLNATSSCATFSADSALCSGTAQAVVETTGNGGLIAIVPGTATARPGGGKWDTGAHEFATGATRTLTVTVVGTGSVSSVPFGISCPSTCSASYSSGTVVTLTATAGSGFAFTGWSGSGCSGTSTCVITLSSNSAVTATFTVLPQAATPTFVPLGGNFQAAQTVTINDTSAGAIKCYTTNGATPQTNGTAGCVTGTLYSGPVAVGVNETLKAVAGGTGFQDSAVGSAAYSFQGSAPTFSPLGGVYTTVQNVTLANAQNLAMCYTVDGSNPTSNGNGSCANGTLYTLVPIVVGVSETIKAIGMKAGWTDSPFGSATYVIHLPAATPTFSPVAGTYTGTKSVTLSTTSAGAIICWNLTGAPATNGTTGCSVGTLYTGAIQVAMSETIFAVAGGTNYSDSPVGSAAYVINYPLGVTVSGVGTVTSNPAGINCTSTCTANFLSGTVVTLTATPGVGSMFTGWSGSGCSGTGTCVVTMNAAQAVTAAFGGNPQANTPTFLPIAGTYNTAQSVAVSSTSPGAIICYTTNGSTPATDGISGCSTGTLYSAPFSVSVNTTVKAVAGGTGYIDSLVGSATYNFQGSAPTFSPSAGTYTGSQNVTLSQLQSLAICFTTDGTTPTSNGSGACSHGNLYSVPITVALNETIKAIGINSGWNDSPVGSAAYVINYTLTVAVTGSGTVTSVPAGINCPGTCSAVFPSTSNVTLSQTPAAGWAFSSWGNACSGSGGCTVVMSGTATVTATFGLNSAGGCTSTATIPPPIIAPFSGFTGAGTYVADPEPVSGGNTSGCFHNGILRVSDGNSGYNACLAQGNTAVACAAEKNKSMFVNSSDGEDYQFSVDGSQFVTINSGATPFIWDTSGGTTATVRYTNFPNHVLKIISFPTFSHVTPKLVYSLANTAGTANGCVLSSYDTSQTWPALPTRTPIYDFSSSVNGVPAAACNPTDPIRTNYSDTQWGTGFSLPGPQGTGQYVTSYIVGLGVSMWDTKGGTVTGDYGGTGTIICQNCPGGVTNPGQFGIHNIKFNRDMSIAYVAVEAGTCVGVCQNGADPFEWQVGTNKVWISCLAGSGKCSGHFVSEGQTSFINNYDTALYIQKPLPGNAGTTFPAAPCGHNSNPKMDQHASWWNNNVLDLNPFFISTTPALKVSQVYNDCGVNEIDSIYPPTNSGKAGLITRYAHNYGAPTSEFATQNQLSTVDASGGFVLMTSPMANSSTSIGQLGDTAGNATCTVVLNCRGDVFLLGTGASFPPPPTNPAPAIQIF